MPLTCQHNRLLGSEPQSLRRKVLRIAQGAQGAVPDFLMDAAKRYRVDTEKLQKTVAKESEAKRDKKTKAIAKSRDQKTAV
jgi:hypothetical protein